MLVCPLVVRVGSCRSILFVSPGPSGITFWMAFSQMQSKCRYRTRRREVRLLRMIVKKSTVKGFLLQCPLVEVIDSKPRLLTGRQSAAHWQSTLDTLGSRADE